MLAAGPDLIVSGRHRQLFLHIAGAGRGGYEHGVPTIEINPGRTPLAAARSTSASRLRAAEAPPALLDASGYTLDTGRG